MAQTYTRQSSFADGDTITAALFNNEFNQLVNAFSYSSSSSSSTGHQHDGTAGGGGNIGKIGDIDFLNKITVSGNTWEFYVEVSSAAAKQLVLQDGALVPNADSDLDLGTSSLYFKDAYIDSITTTGNVAVGGNLTVTGTTTFNGGTLTLGDSAADNVVFGADVDSNIIPDDDDSYDLGSSSQQWRNLFIDGTANIDSLVADTADINGGTIDGAVIGGASAAAITGTAITGTSFVIGSANINEAELEILDGATVTTAELNILDGVTATATELNAIAGVTATTAELNILDGVTSTAAELNILDGVTSTAAELNILDGVTASATDINLIDGITNGTVIASKAIITDSNKDITGGRNITISGELDAATLDISGDADIDGTLEADAITIGGVTLAETISDTVGAMVTSNTESGITVAYQDADNTLDFTIGTLNQDTTGTAGIATTVTITDNENTNENNALIFTAGGDLDGGNLGLESDGDLKYNPSTGTLSVPNISVSGTFSTVNSVTMDANNAVIFEGSTADAHETTLTSIDATGDRTISLPNVSGTIPVLAAVSTTAITSTPEELNVLDGITAVVGELNALDIGSTAVGTAVASKAVILDSNKDYTGVRNFTLSGELDAGSLDVSGDADIDGTLEADAITVGGVTLAETIQDTVGAMVSSNTESGITVAYQDADGTLDFSVTGGVVNEVVDADGDTKIQVEESSDEDTIRFDIAGTEQIVLADGVLKPTTDSDVDLGTSSLYFKDAYIDTITTTGNLAVGGTLNGVGIKYNISNFARSMLISNDGGTGTLDAASDNTGFGHEVFDDLTSGDANTAFGKQALTKLTTGEGNVGIGFQALDALTTGTGNVAIGYNSSGALTTGETNLSIGTNSLPIATTASRNIAIGHSTLAANSSGTKNVALGYEALNDNTTADNNVAIGDLALTKNTTGTLNVAVGVNALDANTTADNNVAIGVESLGANTTGAANVAIGSNALENNTTASDNVSIGAASMGNNTTGANNVAVGRNALNANTTASGNVAVGKDALTDCTTGQRSVAIGFQAMDAATTGGDSVCIGYEAGSAIVDVIENTLLGYYAGSKTVAAYNTAVGASALQENTTGVRNVAMGRIALYANTTAHDNVAIGYAALTANTTGHSNTAVGKDALLANTTGQRNTAVGFDALTATTTGEQNTAIGKSAGVKLTEASNCVLIGNQAADNLTTGSTNICIGTEVADTLTTGNSNILIGNTARPSAGGGANQISMGVVVTCAGDNNFTFGNQGTTSNIAFGANSISTTSDIRLKEDIQDETIGLDFLNDLRPVTFIWKKEKDIPTELTSYKENSEERAMNGKYNHGFIAQEVKATIEKHGLKEGFDMWQEDEADGRQRVAPSAAVPLMIKAIQELSAKVDELQQQLNSKE